MKILITFLLASLVSLSAFSYGLGVVTHPFKLKKSVITGELATIMSDGSGFGPQFRYTNRLTQNFTLDTGFGFGSGERESRFFIGGDYSFFPDVKKQPRLGTKFTFERAKEFDRTRTILGFTPNLSKGFFFGKQKVYPFIALPLELNLDTKAERYAFQSRLSLGATLPIFKQWVANGQLDINLDDSFSAFYLGASYQF